jgi:hypothetical protein
MGQKLAKVTLHALKTKRETHTTNDSPGSRLFYPLVQKINSRQEITLPAAVMFAFRLDRYFALLIFR